MAKLTQENVCMIEHKVISDYASVFDMEIEKDMAMKAVFLEGVHNMAIAVINEIGEVE